MSPPRVNSGPAKQKDRPKAALYSNCKLGARARREVAATPDLFRPDRRIATRAAGWRNDRHIARLRRWCANFRVNSCGRAEHAVGSRQFVAERLRSRVGGRGALRRDGALLRHRLRRRATRRIPRGRWRGRLSRWRRWRRRSLRGCRAGCHQSCQDQKKRLSLHGEQMLPRCRCSLLAEKPTGIFGLPALRIRFPRRPVSGTAFRARTHQRRSWSHGERQANHPS
jgi:hypothetical protein